VKGGSHGEREDRVIENSALGVGWDEMPDLTSFASREALKDKYRSVYPSAGEGRVANQAGQLWTFVHLIGQGDLVVVPLKTRPEIAVGEVVGPYRYTTEYGEDMHHVRPVKWLATDLPRTKFDQDLLYTFGAFMTVSRAERNNAESRVRAMLSDKNPSPPPPAGEPPEPTQVEERDLEQDARDEIVNLVRSRFKGHGMARLVDAILRARGLSTRVSPPGPDGGVDIVAAGGLFGFDTPRMVVQVKSGDDTAGTPVLQALKGAMSDYGANTGLLVCWGGFKNTTRMEARSGYFKVRLWDQTDFLSALFDVYEKLDEEIRAELPLKRVWIVAKEATAED
jgi:restriction system protein